MSPIVPRAAWIALVVVTIGGHAWPHSLWWAMAECAVIGWIVYRVLGRIGELDQSTHDGNTPCPTIITAREDED